MTNKQPKETIRDKKELIYSAQNPYNSRSNQITETLILLSIFLHNCLQDIKTFFFFFFNFRINQAEKESLNGSYFF